MLKIDFKWKKSFGLVVLTTLGFVSFGYRGLADSVQTGNSDNQQPNSEATNKDQTQTLIQKQTVVLQQGNVISSVDDNKTTALGSGSTTDNGSLGADSTNQPATNTTPNTAAQASQDSTQSPRDAALAKYASQHTTGYVYSPEISTANGGWNWLEDGKPFTGFRYYMGTYYWFVDGVRQNAGWRNAWGLTYYTDDNGRAVQGQYNINGQDFNFGNDGTYYLRSTGYLYDGSNQNGGYRWYENGQLYSGFRYYTGTYYWFVDGVRQNAGWRNAWGLTYYTDDNGRAVQGLQTIDNNQYDFGNDGTYYVRKNQTEWIDGQQYRSDNDGKVTPWSGYISNGNEGWRWYENGQLFTGFRYYMGTYYWFENGVRSDNAWHEAWGMKYYTGGDGRAVQGSQMINGQWYFFGNNNTYFARFDKYQVINWFKNRFGALTYSMYGSRTGADGTADCSGAMTEALMEAGASKAERIYSTDTIHDYLKANGYHLIAENSSVNKQVGDIVVWGRQGFSGGAAGHIMVITQPDYNGHGASEISVDYSTWGGRGTAVSENNYDTYNRWNGYPYSYVYRHD